MSKSLLFSLVLICCCRNVLGQEYPTRWKQFTSVLYIYSIEEDFKDSKTSQSDFINSLLNQARLNVAKQVSISIKDKAELVKNSLNGVTDIKYSSNTSYSTEASMRLLKTDSEYYSGTAKGFAIAYLDKNELREYWSKEANSILSKQETDYAKAERMISLGYKEKAKEALEKIKTELSANTIGESLAWLELCSYPADQYQVFLDRHVAIVKKVEYTLLSLGHGITIYLDYHSDLFGEEYPATKNQLSAKMSSDERSFVENPLEADWIIKIDAKAREGQQSSLGNNIVFFGYIDVSLIIVKCSTAQTVYKDAFSIKDGHTLGYKQAAMISFQNLASQLYEVINENLKE